MKIRFLFHNPKGERGVGKLIVAWTGFLALFYNWRLLKYLFSHMEIWLPDENGKFTVDWIDSPGHKRRYYLGQCFSSTTRGDAEGVRFAPAYEVLKHPERWSYIECDVKEIRLKIALCEAVNLVDAQYDFLGLFGFVLPIGIQDEKKWYCSEICMWFGYLVRAVPKRFKRISPRRAAYVLAKLWGEPKKQEGGE